MNLHMYIHTVHLSIYLCIYDAPLKCYLKCLAMVHVIAYSTAPPFSFYCAPSYCTKAKNLFTSLSIPFHHLVLDLVSNGAEIQADLAELSGQRTVPNIFIKGKHVGGCDKVHQLHEEGKLLAMI